MSSPPDVLALNNGIPVRDTMLYYGKQTIDQSDIAAIYEVMTENKFLTTGPRVQQFEQDVCQKLNVKYAVAVSNGTTALHLAVAAIDLKKEDEVIVTSISFVASSNAILYCGGTPVFADVEKTTLNIDVNKIESLITDKTRAIIAVDMAGQLCDYQRLRQLADQYNLVLIRDAAHSFGVQEDGKLADLTTFSFHPVKNITTGEGGMIVTDNPDYYQKMQCLRCHGIDTDYTKRKLHHYDVVELGFNYRLTDLQCALGISQLKRLDSWLERRNQIAQKYNQALEEIREYVIPLEQKFKSAYHIYIIRINLDNLSCDRDDFFQALKAENIGVNVHYRPIHLQTLYQKLGYKVGLCPNAEQVYHEIITLPMYPTLTDQDTDDVILAVKKVANFYKNK